jgi:hypothetical protein
MDDEQELHVESFAAWMLAAQIFTAIPATSDLPPAPAAYSLQLRDVSNSVIRTNDLKLQELIVDGYHRSPTFKHIVDQLAKSGAMVYVNGGLVGGGRYGETSSSAPQVVTIKIAINRPHDQIIVTLAHEMTHAMEQLHIIQAKGVSDTRHGVIETDTALDAGEQVLHELSRTANR